MDRRRFCGFCVAAGLGTIALSKREFLHSAESSPESSPFSLEIKKTSIILREENQLVWQYHFGFLTHEHVPVEDPRRQAGCYFHPVYGMNGEILTDNAPKDHYHHHGIFWTWPHVLLHEKDGTKKEYDLWTGNTQIHQFFTQWLEQKVEKDRAILAVENGWYIGQPVLNADGNIVSGEKVMKETVRVTTNAKVNCEGFSGRFLDFEFSWTPVGRDISLRGAENKSYGGFTIRFRPPNAKSAETRITTPEGIASADLPEKPLTWADYTSVFTKNSSSKSGGTIFIPKYHPDFPPTWLVRFYGPLCVGWPGVKAQKIKENETVRLHYRVWIHDGQPNKDQIEKIYRQYSDTH